MSQRSKRFLILLGFALMPAASISAVVVTAGGGGDETLRGSFQPRIDSKPIPVVAGPKPKPAALPKGARALFPGFAGDSVFLALRPKVVGAQAGAQVYQTTIKPLLQAIGFGKAAGSVGIPHSQGTRLPRASLATVAGVTCRELDRLRKEGYVELCQVMQGLKPATPAVDKIFLNGEGETFAQFKADIERQRIEYVFPQLVGKVPIEHSGLVAGRWEGETVTEVSGTIFTRLAVTNKVGSSLARVAPLALRQLGKLKGVTRVGHPPARGDLVLLPYGAGRFGGRTVPGLRYAYRVLLFGQVKGAPPNFQASWLAWIDAQSGVLLKLLPQFNFVSATGVQWRRAVDVGTQLGFFQVDPASGGGQYTLQLAGFMNRVDRFGNGTFGDGEVSISASTGGSSSTFAAFDQAPVNDAANARCQAGGNTAFRQANDFSHLYSMRSLIVGVGIGPSFPESAITTRTDMPGIGNSAGYDAAGAGQSVLNFANGDGAGGDFPLATCPSTVDTKENGSTDSTTLVHELAHLSTKRLQERRPSNWCGTGTCSLPVGYSTVHDLADAMAHAYASINCMGGWSKHNNVTVNGSLNCVANSSEGGGLPRLSQANVPFDAASPGDHFPEHRLLGTGDYADMQIAAAILWAVREGMRSKCLPSGTPQYFVRLIRAIWDAGFMTTSCTNCDRDLYRLLQDLERQMVNQWATAGQPGGPPGFAHNGSHTTNKVMSGNARGGVFLVPYQCVDGDSATTDPSFCPGGENGGDAIVDIDDNSTANDVTIDAITHPTYDYLLRSGGPPTFRVWTGPRYKFTSGGSATGFTPSGATPSPCYVQYQVELSNDQTFSTVVTSTTGTVWQTVSATSAPQCYGTWTPSAATWNTLKGTSGETRVYYRVRTRDAAGTAATERISTAPANGLFTVPPAYAIVNPTGTP